VRLRWNQRWNQKQTARAHSRRSRSYAVPEDIPLLAPGTAALPPAGSRSSGCRCPLSMCHRQTCRSPGRMSRRPNRARSRSRREPDSFSASVAYRVGHLDAIYEFQDLLLSESRRPARGSPARSTMPGIYAMPGRVRRAIVRLRDTTSLDRTTRPGMTAAMSRNLRAINSASCCLS
jgi:hypothetical protein